MRNFRHRLRNAACCSRQACNWCRGCECRGCAKKDECWDAARLAEKACQPRLLALVEQVVVNQQLQGGHAVHVQPQCSEQPLPCADAIVQRQESLRPQQAHACNEVQVAAVRWREGPGV